MYKTTRFIGEEDKKVWITGSEENPVFSACLKAVDKVFNPETGFENIRTHMIWVKTTESIDAVEALVVNVAKLINTGKFVPYAVFSDTPFFDGDTEDINPTTELALGRYSSTRLGSASKALDLDRTYVEVVDLTPAVETVKKAVKEEKVPLEA